MKVLVGDGDFKTGLLWLLWFGYIETSRYQFQLVIISYWHLMAALKAHPSQDFTNLLWYSFLSSVLVTCSMLCGFLTSLWDVWRVMGCGHLCVLMSALVYRTAGEKLLTSFMKGILLNHYKLMLSHWFIIDMQCLMERMSSGGDLITLILMLWRTAKVSRVCAAHDFNI